MAARPSGLFTPGDELLETSAQMQKARTLRPVTNEELL